MSSKWTDFDDSFQRLEKRQQERELYHPKTYTEKSCDELLDSMRKPENDFGKGYSQDFLRRYGRA
jgi:hypothetical protein